MSGGPIMRTSHLKMSFSSIKPAEKPSTGFLFSSGRTQGKIFKQNFWKQRNVKLKILHNNNLTTQTRVRLILTPHQTKPQKQRREKKSHKMSISIRHFFFFHEIFFCVPKTGFGLEWLPTSLTKFDTHLPIVFSITKTIVVPPSRFALFSTLDLARLQIPDISYFFRNFL